MREKENEKKDFFYTMKLRTAIISFILFLILSSNMSYQILKTIFININNNPLIILNEKNKPTFISKLIMAFIIAIILFVIAGLCLISSITHTAMYASSDWYKKKLCADLFRSSYTTPYYGHPLIVL